MKTLLGVIVLGVCGWVVWSYVVQPAVRSSAPPPTPTVAVARHTPTPTPPPTPGDQGAAVTTVAHDFLAAWAASRYDDMYDILSAGARASISSSAFVARYRGIAAEATITRVKPAIVDSQLDGNRAVVTYTVDMSTTAVGPIRYTDSMPLHFDGQRWGVGWTPDLIFPGLGTAYKVHLYQEVSHRGSIVDRQGQPLALQVQQLQVGVVPQYIHDEKGLLAFLSSFLHKPADAIRAMYHVSWAQQNPTDLVPIGTVSSLQWNAVPDAQKQALGNNGLDVQPGPWQRIYPRGSLASALLGYVSSVDGHGVAGLEHWADSYLTGQDGAKLAIAMAPDFQYTVSKIAEKPKQDGATVHLTIDSTLQAAAEKALAGKTGAVVAIRPSDGAVLALASAPGFDPNGFARGLTTAQYQALVDSPHHPLLNHATEGQYPLGSIFKIIAMGAALEKGGYTADTQIAGPGVWYGLGPNYPMRDWLPSGHGIISLHEALVQSCDTCFYQVGQHLDQINHYLLPDYARSWGFGAPTGIVGVPEGAGIIPDPHWTLSVMGQPWVPGDAVNMTIGQGFVEVTPLQAAQMLAALGDNGVMHRPYVVQSITAPDGKVIKSYPPVVSRTLPLSPAHLQDILSAMLGVTTEPYGTATNIFAGFKWPVMGKTGTAQASSGLAYAWFAALAPADHPRIALITLIEHGGEGSEVAAPIARQVLQTFFTQDPDLAGTSPTGAHTLPVS